MNKTKSRSIAATRNRLALLCLTVAIATGCSSRPLKTDAMQARELLQTTLEAWQQGKSIEDLKNLKPPVFVGDLRWQRGDKIKEFKIKSEGDFHESSVSIPVSIRFANEPKNREVIYWVSTNPALTVTLAD